MWKRVSATWGNRVSPHSIDSSWSCWRSFLCGNGSFPHRNDFIPPGNDSIPHRNEPKPTVGGWKPIRSRSNRHENDRKPHGGAAKPNTFFQSVDAGGNGGVRIWPQFFMTCAASSGIILAALRKARHFDGKHVQAEEQILTKAAGFDGFLKIAICGGNNADIHLDRQRYTRSTRHGLPGESRISPGWCTMR